MHLQYLIYSFSGFTLRWFYRFRHFIFDGVAPCPFAKWVIWRKCPSAKFNGDRTQTIMISERSVDEFHVGILWEKLKRGRERERERAGERVKSAQSSGLDCQRSYCHLVWTFWTAMTCCQTRSVLWIHIRDAFALFLSCVARWRQLEGVTLGYLQASERLNGAVSPQSKCG